MEGNRERIGRMIEESEKQPKAGDRPVDEGMEFFPDADILGAMEEAIDDHNAKESAKDSAGKIGRMIDASLEGQERPDTGDRPVDEGMEFSPDADVLGTMEEAMNEAIEDRTSVDAVEQADMGSKASIEIRNAFEAQNDEAIADAVKGFTNDGGDVTVLRKQVQLFAEAYKNLGDERMAKGLMESFENAVANLDAEEASPESGERLVEGTDEDIDRLIGNVG